MSNLVLGAASFLMQQEEIPTGGLAAMGVMLVVWLAVVVFCIAVFWKLFSKAGEPGWACLIPIYNTIVFCKICGKPWWWFILLCIPGVNFIILIILDLELAKRFGKSTGFAIGLILLFPIFCAILAFGSARYQG